MHFEGLRQPTAFGFILLVAQLAPAAHAATLHDSPEGTAPPPSILRIVPQRILQGQTRQLTMLGSEFVEGGSLRIVAPSGVQLLSTSVVDSTEVLLEVQVATDATLGERGVRWRNPDGQTDGLSRALTVEAQAAQEYTFTDVTAAAGVANEDFGHFGVTWSDFNKDGWLDLYCANGEQPDPFGPEDINTLYQNRGDGTFLDITALSGAGDPWVAMRNIWADYDRDGDLDFYSHNFLQSTLYQNNQNQFSDVNGPSGAGLEMFRGTGAAWCDFDSDGWLDLHATSFSLEEGDWQALLHNNGDGTFTNIQALSGLPFEVDGMGNACADYDRDGDQDIAVAAVTPTDGNVLYRNDGNLTFSAVTGPAGIVLEPGGSGSAVTWGDYDNDGWLDLVFTEVNLGSQKVLLPRIYLFRNQRDGTFADVTAEAGLTLPEGTVEFWHASWADYDNDGDFDLFVGAEGPNSLFRNNGDGTFTDVAPDLGLDRVEEGKGGAWGDYDNDGDLDLYVIQHADPGLSRVPNVLYRNEGGSNHWLQVELTGTCSNPDAIGARISVTVGANLQTQELNGGTGFFDQHTPILQFGLAAASLADEVRVLWPSGQTQVVSGVGADQRLPLVEPIGCTD